jgi:hypothetical protein
MFAEIRAQGPFFTLFVTLVLLLIIAPITQTGRLGGALLQAGYTLVLLAAVWGVRSRKPQRTALWFVGVPALAVGWASLSYDSAALQSLSGVLTVLFTAVVIALLIGHVARARRVTIDTLYAAFSAYLLIAILFAALYSFLEIVQPGSVGLSIGEGSSRETWDSFYFSLVTLTTLGYGDITPAFGIARTLAPMEAVLGQLYIAALVARLVGLWTAQQQAEEAAGE